MEIKVYNINGSETGRTITLDDSIFAIEPNDHAIYLDVKQYLADQRQGTSKAKERSENAHSTRKLKRQKGTGGAALLLLAESELDGLVAVFLDCSHLCHNTRTSFYHSARNLLSVGIKKTGHSDFLSN